MKWRVLPGVAVVILHTMENPRDDEWNAYLKEVEPHVRNVKGLFVYTEKAGPSAAQRAAANAQFERVGAPQTAVMTSSRLIIGIVTAFSWAIGSKAKAFTLSNFKDAAESLKLTESEKIRVRDALKEMAASLNVTLAFTYP